MELALSQTESCRVREFFMRQQTMLDLGKPFDKNKIDICKHLSEKIREEYQSCFDYYFVN